MRRRQQSLIVHGIPAMASHCNSYEWMALDFASISCIFFSNNSSFIPCIFCSWNSDSVRTRPIMSGFSFADTGFAGPAFSTQVVCPASFFSGEAAILSGKNGTSPRNLGCCWQALTTQETATSAAALAKAGYKGEGEDGGETFMTILFCTMLFKSSVFSPVFVRQPFRAAAANTVYGRPYPFYIAAAAGSPASSMRLAVRIPVSSLH